jgi:hypothetical protein
VVPPVAEGRRVPPCAVGLSVSTRVKSWLVQLESGSSDWLEERVWRIPLSGDDAAEPALPLHALHLAAVLVGDQNWSPAHTGWTTSPTTGGQVQGLVVPGILIGVPRWW